MIYILAIVYCFIIYYATVGDKNHNNNVTCIDINNYKSNYGVWMEWTGASYVERINPNPTQNTNLSAVIQYNALTGCWEELDCRL